MRMRVFGFGGLALVAAVAVTLLSTPPPETREISLVSPPAAYAPSIDVVMTHSVLASAWEVRIPPSLSVAGHDLFMAKPKFAHEGWGGHSIGGGSANLETEDGFIAANGPRHHLLL